MHWFSKKPIQPFFGGKNLPSPPPPFSSSSSSSFLRFLKPLSSLPFSPPPFLPSSPSISSLHLEPTSSKFVASSFKEWLSSRDPAIFNVLSSHHGDEGAAALSRLHLRLSESFVLQVLAHLRSRADVLTCPRFFDWAGRQRHFHHTRATFHAIFKILSRARLMTVMLDWLHAFSGHHRIRFHDTLVMGYAVAGQPDIALFLLGKMRFQGLDLNPFAYHVLFNALVEQSRFDAAEVISKQISMRGLDSEITSCIRMKNLCKQGRIDDAQAFLRQLGSSGAIINKRIIGVLVNALCKKKRFNDACTLLEEFGQSRKVPTAPTYSLWISNLIDAGKVDQALNFFHSKKKTEGFVPDTLSYNKLICGLLRDNRLAEVYHLLAEMWEAQIAPDKVTMNAALCFFCKAGMVDVAVELYNSRLGIGLTRNGFSYYHLIKALCGDGSIDEACQVFEDSLKQGYFPGKTAFQFLADSLCRDGRLDEMSKLMDAALQKNIKPISSLCVKYISALCKAGKAEEGYLVPCKFNRPRTTVLKSNDYVSLIDGLIKLNRGDVASRLLLEMQESGYPPSQKLYRSVICYLCRTANLQQVLNILDMHLPHEEDGGAKNRHIFNYFIDGAGQALKPELAREVFERMSLRGIQPNMDTNILMLCSYLKSKCIGDALNFFNDLANKHEPSNRLYNIMIVGLCKAGKPDHALEMWSEVRERGMVPTLHCYEELVNVLCTSGDYDKAIKVLNDFQKTGRNVSSFIGNTILSHTLEKPELNRAWVQSSALDGEELMLGQLVGTFSGGIRVREHLDSLEEVVEQFFQINIFTCNILLRELTMEGRMDYACDLFHSICKKGYQPNRWTYDIIVHGFCKHGRRKEAERWMEAMYRNGFYPTFSTVGKYNNIKIKGE